MGDLIEDNPQFLRQLMRHEGSRRDRRGRHKTYRCASGALTIGYGHNLDARPIPGVGEGDVLCEDEARELLDQDVRAAARALDARLPWWRHIGEARSAVLLNMAFNMGVGRLLTFKNTLRAVREARWRDAKTGMLASRWAAQVKGRAVQLAAQMLTGEWQGGA